MKTARTALLLFFCARLAQGEEPLLRFSAEVRDEMLAEETILLVHCLADRDHVAWEYTPDPSGALWLRAREESGEVRGTFHRNGSDLPFRFASGDSDSACEKLAANGKKAAAPEAPLSLTPQSREPSLVKANGDPTLGALATADVSESESKPARTWLWVAGVAAVVGGVLIWRARQPSYGSVEMR